MWRLDEENRKWCKYNDWSCPHIDAWGKCKIGVENCVKDKEEGNLKADVLRR